MYAIRNRGFYHWNTYTERNEIEKMIGIFLYETLLAATAAFVWTSLYCTC